MSQAQQHELNVVMRKVARLHASIDKAVAVEERAHAIRLSRRYSRLNVLPKVAAERAEKNASLVKAKDRLQLEVDFFMEKKQETRAARQFSSAQLELQLPAWFKTVMQIIASTRAGGHTNKSKWRSHALHLFRRCIRETEDDPNGSESRQRLRDCVQNINNVDANTLVRILEDLKSQYLDDPISAGYKLSMDSAMFKQSRTAMEEIDGQLVPLSRDDWSVTLQGLTTSLSSTTISHPQPLSAAGRGERGVGGRSRTTKNGFPALVEKGAIHASVHPYCHNEKQTQAVKLMRTASMAGDFPLCMSLFVTNFDPPIGQETIGRTRPTLAVFRSLMMAFKNAPVAKFEDAYQVMDLIKLYGYVPDAPIQNLLLKACVSGSRWRRALAIYKDMLDVHKIAPTIDTFTILAKCCAKSADSPDVIFETLRQYRLTREYCYRAALGNAGNRIPPHLNETIKNFRASATYPSHSHIKHTRHAPSNMHNQ